MEESKWRESVQNYKDFYLESYGRKPSEKLLESYCRSNGIPWPLPRVEKLESIPESFWREREIDG